MTTESILTILVVDIATLTRAAWASARSATGRATSAAALESGGAKHLQ